MSMHPPGVGEKYRSPLTQTQRWCVSSTIVFGREHTGEGRLMTFRRDEWLSSLPLSECSRDRNRLRGDTLPDGPPGARILDPDARRRRCSCSARPSSRGRSSSSCRARCCHQDNDRCFSGRDIPQHDRREGAEGYRLCVECARLDQALLSAASAGTVVPV